MAVVSDPETPIPPVPVRVADQVIDDVHHVIAVRILFADQFSQAFSRPGQVTAHISGGNDTFILRCAQFASGDAPALIFHRFIQHLRHAETAGNPAGKQFSFQFIRIAVLEKQDFPSRRSQTFGWPANAENTSAFFSSTISPVFRAIMPRSRSTTSTYSSESPFSGGGFGTSTHENCAPPCASRKNRRLDGNVIQIRMTERELELK